MGFHDQQATREPLRLTPDLAAQRSHDHVEVANLAHFYGVREDSLRKALEPALLARARRTLGGDYVLAISADEGDLDLHAYFTVVAQVGEPAREVSLDQVASNVAGIGVGDELGIRLGYSARDDDSVTSLIDDFGITDESVGIGRLAALQRSGRLRELGQEALQDALMAVGVPLA